MASSTENALTDLRSLIISAVASEGNIGSNVFLFGGVEDDPPFPYIVLQFEGTDDGGMRTHGGGINAERFEFSVHVHTRMPSQGITLRDLIVNTLSGFSGVHGNTTFGSLFREGEASFCNKELKTNELIIDFNALITNN